MSESLPHGLATDSCVHIVVINEQEFRRFALRFIHSHSDATGVFRNAILGNCRVDNFRQPR